MLILLLLVVFLYDSYDALQRSNTTSQQILIEQKHKQAHLDEMRNLARERTVLLFYMLFENDPFVFDDYKQRYAEAARQFIKHRFELEAMHLSKEEVDILAMVRQVTNNTSNAQGAVIEQLIDGHYATAEQLFKEQVIDSQQTVFRTLDKMSHLLAKVLDKETKQVEADVLQQSRQFTLYAIALTVLSIAFIAILIIYIFKKEKLHFIETLERTQQSADALSYQASHDALTGLINRKEFENQLSEVLRHLHAFEGGVLYLDLDQFKVVNDTCGHHAGDELLKQIAHLMKQQLRQSDLIARLGGDEFGIILKHCDEQQVKQIAQKLIDCIAAFQFFWEENLFRIGVSIGIVFIKGKQSSMLLHEVLKQADAACFAAKDSGRNCFRVYSSSDKDYVQHTEQMTWLSRINEALINDQFVLYAQAIQGTNDDMEVLPSYEILVRMQENTKLIPPGSFLPAAERYEQMDKIDRWVVKNTLQILQSQHQFLATIDHVSINLSALSLADKKFLDYLIEELTQAGLETKVCLEITETAAVNSLSNIQRFISILHGMGVRFSLDDFGTGMSSFSYLKNLDVDYLKIDGQFIKNILHDSVDRSMVKSMREIGHAMNKKIIAEFVESEEVLNLLKNIGVDYAQGYGIHKPQPLTDIINREKQ